MILLLASKKDPAAMNIVESLKEKGIEPDNPQVVSCSQAMLSLLDQEVVEVQSVTPEVEEIIVLSRHVGSEGRPSLTVHVPGELDKMRLAVAAPQTVRRILINLSRFASESGLNYSVSLEATHHGPSHLDLPMTFVEIGSTQKEWCEKKAADVVALAVLESLKGGNGRPAVGVGGPHYAPRHTEVSLRSEVAVGHVIPNYVNITPELVKTAIRRTNGKVEFLVADWKGLNSAQREVVRSVSNTLGIRLVKSIRELV